MQQIGYADQCSKSAVSGDLYDTLDEVCAGDARKVAKLQGLLHQTIDRLRVARAAPESVRIAEQMSVTVHQIAIAAKHGRGQATAERALLERRLERLGRQWLLASPILH